MKLLSRLLGLVTGLPLAVQFLGAIIVGLAGFAALERWKLRRMERELLAARLEVHNADARADSTRLLMGRAAAAFGQGLAVWQRKFLQERQERDAIDRALNQERVLSANLAVMVRGLREQVVAGAGTRETPEGVRTDAFFVRQEPFTVSATASLPRPPAPGTLVLHRVDVDTARLQFRVGCEPPDARGIRSVAATVAGPPWLPLRLGELSTTPETCNAKALEAIQSRGGVGRWVLGKGATIVVWEGAKALARRFLGVKF